MIISAALATGQTSQHLCRKRERLLVCVQRGAGVLDFAIVVTYVYSKSVEVGCLSLKEVDCIQTQQIANVVFFFVFFSYSVERGRQLKM